MLWQYQYLKYRIGDKVKIKDNLNEGILRDSDGRAIAYISSSMLDFQNTLTTITNVNVKATCGEGIGFVGRSEGAEVNFELTANGEVVEDKEGNKSRVFGIEIKQKVSGKFKVGASLKYAWGKFWATVDQMGATIGNLFTGGISINSLSGPVGIYTVVGESRKAGFENIIRRISVVRLMGYRSSCKRFFIIRFRYFA